MSQSSTLIRCRSCRTLNRVPREKVMDRAKCGKCGALLDILKAPVEVTEGTFEQEVLSWPGSVLVVFWSPV